VFFFFFRGIGNSINPMIEDSVVYIRDCLRMGYLSAGDRTGCPGLDQRRNRMSVGLVEGQLEDRRRIRFQSDG